MPCATFPLPPTARRSRNRRTLRSKGRAYACPRGSCHDQSSGSTSAFHPQRSTELLELATDTEADVEGAEEGVDEEVDEEAATRSGDASCSAWPPASCCIVRDGHGGCLVLRCVVKSSRAVAEIGFLAARQRHSRHHHGRSGEGEGGCCGPEGAAKEAAERLHRSVQLLPEVHVGLSHDPHRCESPPPKSSLSSTPGLTVSVHLSPHCHGVYTPPLLFVAPPNASRTDVPLSRSL